MTHSSISTGTLLGAVLATSVSAASFAQTTDDWDFGTDADRRLTIAAVTFENFGVAVRCRENTLSVLLSGLPPGQGVRQLSYRIGDAAPQDTSWVSAAGSTTAFALWPASIAEGLAAGGRLQLGVRDGERVRRIDVELPPSTTAIPDVFEACGRDAPSSVASTAPSRENMAGLSWQTPPRPSFPDRTGDTAGIAALTCPVLANGRLRDCRIESEFPEGGGFGRAATLGTHKTGRVHVADGSGGDIEGRQIAFAVRYQISNEAPLPLIASRLPQPLENNDR